MPTKQFLCTRPKLVTELQKRGYKPKVVPSPWADGKTAWIFDVDEDLTEVVNAYYKRIGKRSPLDVADDAEKRYTLNGIEVRAV